MWNPHTEREKKIKPGQEITKLLGETDEHGCWLREGGEWVGRRAKSSEDRELVKSRAI